MTKPTRVDSCQYLLSTPINYTLTHFGEHSENFSHDQINRYLGNARLTPRIVGNHIGSAFLVWVHLMRKAYETGQTLYQVKHGVLSESLAEQLKSPALKNSAA